MAQPSCRFLLAYLCRHSMVTVAVGHNQPEGDLGRCQLHRVLQTHMTCLGACMLALAQKRSSASAVNTSPQVRLFLGRC